jgi:hypothetical protein
LLHELAPDEEKFYAKGAAEVKEEIEKMKLAKPLQDLACLSQ